MKFQKFSQIATLVSLISILSFSTPIFSNAEQSLKIKQGASQTKFENKTLGKWWMWACGSGLLIIILFAFNTEADDEKSIRFK